MTEDIADSTPLGVGAQLAAARAGLNLSVADIARQLKFSPLQVEALEAERYRQLPDAVFTRGFIRNYARLVGLDPAPLLAVAEPNLSHHGHFTAELPPSANIPFPTRSRVKWHRYVIAVAVLGTPLALFEWYHDDSEVIDPTAALTKPTLPVAAVVSPPPAPIAADSLPIENAPEDKPPAPLPAAAAPLPAVTTTASYHLKFVFDKESWVEVRDGHGHRLMRQLNPAGSQQTVDGVPPLSVVVGNAGSVHLELNHQPVDLAPHTEIDVARLTLE